MTEQEKALEKFMESNATIISRLEMLKEYFENHTGIGPEDVTWAHVGSELHVIDLLDEVFEFLDLN
jgi:hypothetical protein